MPYVKGEIKKTSLFDRLIEEFTLQPFAKVLETLYRILA